MRIIKAVLVALIVLLATGGSLHLTFSLKEYQSVDTHKRYFPILIKDLHLGKVALIDFKDIPDQCTTLPQCTTLVNKHDIEATGKLKTHSNVAIDDQGSTTITLYPHNSDYLVAYSYQVAPDGKVTPVGFKASSVGDGVCLLILNTLVLLLLKHLYSRILLLKATQ